MSSIDSRHGLQRLLTVLQCCCRVQRDFEGGWHQHHSSGPGFRHSYIQLAACSACVQHQLEPAEPDSASARSRRAALLCLSAARTGLSTSACKSLTSHRTSICHATFPSLPQPCTQHYLTVITCCTEIKAVAHNRAVVIRCDSRCLHCPQQHSNFQIGNPAALRSCSLQSSSIPGFKFCAV